MKAAVLTEFGKPLVVTNDWKASDVLHSMTGFGTVGIAVVNKF